MWCKPYGKTGKEISVIGFGGMRFANPEDIDANAEIVLYAHEKGINYFDTAPNYCKDKSEDIVGAAITQMKRDEFHVSTKCMSADGGEFRAGLEKSLERLHVNQIDFFHLWCITSPDVWQQRIKGGAVDAAVKAKQEGLVGHIVVSTHMQGDDIRAMLAEGPFEGVTLGYCAINFPYRQSALDAAAETGLGVVTMNPLGGGLIPQNPERLGFLCGPDDDSVVAAALRFNVSQPAVTSALVGFTTKEHVDEACAAVEDFKPHGPEHIASLCEKITDSFDGMCTGCGYCLPCPEDVPIPQMMDSYNQKILSGDRMDPIIPRLKWHWNVPADSAEACSLCGACEEKCTQHLPIRQRLSEIADFAAKKAQEQG